MCLLVERRLQPYSRASVVCVTTSCVCVPAACTQLSALVKVARRPAVPGAVAFHFRRAPGTGGAGAGAATVTAKQQAGGTDGSSKRTVTAQNVETVVLVFKSNTDVRAAVEALRKARAAAA